MEEKELLKVFIVDDDRDVRMGMFNGVNWEELGFLPTGQAENGVEAIEKIKIHQPDVLLTDIRMEKMDGMQLISFLSDMYPKIKIVLVSGYSDIEYYKKALRYKVFDFILKPTCLEDFQQVFSKLREEIYQERLQEKKAKLFEKMEQSGKLLSAQKFIEKLLNNEFSSEEELTHEWKIQNINLSYKNIFVVCITYYTDTLSIENEKKENSFIQQIVIDTLDDILQEANVPHLLCAYNLAETICMCSNLEQRELEILLERALGEFSTETKCRGFAGVSEKSRTLWECGYFYKQAYIAMRQVTYLKECNVVSYNRLFQLPHIHKVDFNHTVIMRSLFSTFDSCWLNEIEDVFQGCINHVSFDYDYIDCICNNLYFDVTVHLRELVQQFEETENFLAIISSFLSLEQKKHFLIQVLKSIQYMAENEKNDNKSKTIIRINRIINKNFKNPQISLDFVSKEIGYSPAYLSSLYKQETNQNINDIIVARRIEYAKELLRTTNDKTYKIAQEVGYADCSYFIKVFKKYVKLSPKEYRDSVSRMEKTDVGKV